MAGVIEVQDMARVHPMLVVPSPRRPVSSAELAVFNARLAPIEMASPSLHLAASFPPSRPAHKPSAPSPSEPPPPLGKALPVYSLPLTYAACGLVVGLCNVLVPQGVVTCAHLLSPVWTLALALQALAEPDQAWAWLGWLTILLLPITLLLLDPLFACFYLLALAAFGSGRFWQTLRGPAFILVCVCWFGVATACTLAVLAEHPRAQLGVASLFAVMAIIVSSASRFAQLRVCVT
jgi:hypothetical protein